MIPEHERWAVIKSHYQAEYERRVREEAPEAVQHVETAIILLAFETLREWGERIARYMGIPDDEWWAETQELGWMLFDAEMNLLKLCVDVSDRSDIRLNWSYDEVFDGEPQPLEHFPMALAAAQMFLQPWSRAR